MQLFEILFELTVRGKFIFL